MLRTALTICLCAALALAAAPAPASQDNKDDEGRSGGHEEPTYQIVELVLEKFGRFRPRGVLVLVEARLVEVAETEGADFGVDWSKGSYFLPIDEAVEAKDENKLDLGKIPLLGSIFKQDTVASRFRDAAVVGGSFRMDDLIVIVPEGEVPPSRWVHRVHTTVLADDGRSFAIAGLLEETTDETRSKVPVLGDIPVLGNLFRIGDARWTKSSLLIQVTPHVIEREPR